MSSGLQCTKWQVQDEAVKELIRENVLELYYKRCRMGSVKIMELDGPDDFLLGVGTIMDPWLRQHVRSLRQVAGREMQCPLEQPRRSLQVSLLRGPDYEQHLRLGPHKVRRRH
jgi:hypothetical protein